MVHDERDLDTYSRAYVQKLRDRIAELERQRDDLHKANNELLLRAREAEDRAKRLSEAAVMRFAIRSPI